jgi:hypothetical protein
MARKSIEWSSNAKIELFEILDFYYKRNGIIQFFISTQ